MSSSARVGASSNKDFAQRCQRRTLLLLKRAARYGARARPYDAREERVMRHARRHRASAPQRDAGQYTDMPNDGILDSSAKRDIDRNAGANGFDHGIAF